MTQIPANLLNSNNVVGQVTGVVSEVQNLSAGAQARLSIIENAIPDNLFTLPDANLNGLGTVSLEEVEQKVNTTVDSTINTLNAAVPDLSNLPRVSGLVGLLLDQLPQKIEVPNLAEIKEVVYNKIKRLKKQQQEAVIAAQLYEAKLEETPFTARRNLVNQRNQL